MTKGYYVHGKCYASYRAALNKIANRGVIHVLYDGVREKFVRSQLTLGYKEVATPEMLDMFLARWADNHIEIETR